MNRDLRAANLLLLIFSALSLVMLSLPLTGKIGVFRACAAYLVNPGPYYGTQVLAKMANLPAEVGGGAFRLALDSPGRAYRIIEAIVNWRSRLLNLPYGDQALFVRRQLYGSLGGFRAFPLMEDVDFVRRLRAASRLVFPRPRALTSARRWERLGIFRVTVENWGLLALFGVGCPPARLATIRRRLG